ncbi:MAG TPA: hypothetical protein VE981_15155 [Planctomycetota bacterium]|nr:hypothetical protein [Planctomycetota bacterium]
MNKSVWAIAIMGVFTVLFLAVGMTMTLSQFQETPAIEWVRLGETISREFKAQNVGVRVNLRSNPGAMIVNYESLVDSHFDLSMQLAEMEKVAAFVAATYKGRDLALFDEIQVTRSESHGRGCFRQTYSSHQNYPNPMRKKNLPPPFPGSQPLTPRER